MSTDNTGFEVPEQMRDFAEKSVDQARKAFDDFMGATHKAVSNVEDSASAVQANAADVNKKALTYAEEHVNAAFKFAQELVKADNVEDMMKLQQSYLRGQMESLGEQSREFSNAATKAVQDAAKAAQKK
ncbi:MAG: phasin [Roseibium album]|uniref:Phasin n=1 Tax=Roseibium album TaxID=311410 RepID=A0A0M6ZGK5_9HYPH|nr:phasin [Roseibium album]MBG6146287.1 phasin [Labrenzia sp. EL_142]MBG6154854.1 phasin [Labrenzia sp. EL_162]MBG6162112.1 phasin [Labrenzia sp. EL_195]MBG6174170.1 phasin [Labrenzia sp. EL_132]MBG6193016.1 phasin [Labrenzia sp. EL_159]MBG6199403.1 phasin [Labrenzia sp. EL_13]MBG6209486.1 phasin [Labrenzia sp. EL_126]MBG6228374.1 phasin [Labrenzia sp. EL_208]MCR9057913.1 phasin [Paracoccaceae bacterium]